jgi:hypothetical protein
MKFPRGALAWVALLSSGLLTWSVACGGGGTNLFPTAGTSAGGNGGASSGTGNGVGTGNSGNSGHGGALSGGFVTGSGAAGTASGTPCTGLACQIHSCSGGGTTTISGTIYDPAGKNPLYGVVAYVPNSKPAPLTSGASCYTCGDLYTGDPIAAAITDATGKFTIKNAPDGATIPLVIQVGKWRRQFTIPSVAMCADTPLADKMLTLPKNGTEGDIPNIAISTGSADTLECLLSRVGVDKAEYVPGASGAGHLHIFRGNGGAPDTSPKSPDPSVSLWDSANDIKKYDIVLLSCEGAETANMNQQVMFDYAAEGGRIFASHFHYAWFNTGPFGMANLAKWTPGSNQIGNSLNATIVTTFPEGQSFHDWLQNVNALTNDELPIDAPRHNANVTAANTVSQPWIVADNNSQSPGATQDFTVDTPIGVPAAQQCGRVVFSDMHVGAASGDYGSSNTTPAGCADNDLSPQEKALEFILFDLSSCVTPDGGSQMPPPVGTPQ